MPASVASLRTSIAAIAEAHGADEERIDAVRLAISEAVTNAVEHAYPDGGGEVHVTATVLLGQLLVVVADDGCGLHHANESPGLGLGLPLIAVHADRCVLATPAMGGVQVEMRFDLERAGTHPLAA